MVGWALGIIKLKADELLVTFLVELHVPFGVRARVFAYRCVRGPVVIRVRYPPGAAPLATLVILHA